MLRRARNCGLGVAVLACFGCGGDDVSNSADDGLGTSRTPRATRTLIAGGLTATPSPGSPTRTPTADLNGTRTATPSASPTPARTGPPRPQAALQIDSAGGVPGATVEVGVTLADVHPGVAVAALQNDLSFDPQWIQLAVRANGLPDCSANPQLGKEATSFAFQPPACIVGQDCTGMRVLVLSIVNVDVIPSGSLLYTCRFVITADAESGDVHTLPCSNALASTPDGNAVELECPASEIEVLNEVVP